MPSFDVVSEVDMQEVDNAVNQALKEIHQRYDFKGTHNEIALDKGAMTLRILAADDYKSDAINDILKGKMIRRGLSARALDFGAKEPASNGAVRQQVTVQQGISKEKAKRIVKAIKDSKLKVQAQIMEDQVRVTGKKIDDLQAVMHQLKGENFDIDLQFINLRS